MRKNYVIYMNNKLLLFLLFVSFLYTSSTERYVSGPLSWKLEGHVPHGG